ncbi:MAG TPA: ABC transporter permease [Candidatus Aminicenantes bacterium]|nr:ABC transporter permease [Candidatus Aminicenantes bacterium]
MILKMAFRNVFRRKRRSLLTALSMFGGFVLAAFFIGFPDGSYNHIIDAFTRTRLGHIQIHHHEYLETPSLYRTVDNPGRLGDILDKTEEIENWTPRLYSAGLAAAKEKSAGVRIIGVHPQQEHRTTGFGNRIVEGKSFSSSTAKETIIGKGLAKLLHAGIGNDIVIISQAADGSIANERYGVVGILDSGNEVDDRSAFYLPLNEAQELLVLGERVHEIAMVVTKLGRVGAITRNLRTRIGSSEIQVAPWQEFAESFYKAMKADQEGMWIMLLVIVLVVAVGILNTVLMSVLERQREYGMLRAVGTRPGQIVRLVLAEVMILAAFCIAAGTLAGLLINHVFSLKGIRFADAFTYGGMAFETIRTEINLRSFTIPTATVLLSALLVSLIPALKAAHTDPARSMRIH